MRQFMRQLISCIIFVILCFFAKKLNITQGNSCSRSHCQLTALIAKIQGTLQKHTELRKNLKNSPKTQGISKNFFKNSAKTPTVFPSYEWLSTVSSGSDARVEVEEGSPKLLPDATYEVGSKKDALSFSKI